jgi:hypothetical protein
MAIDHPGAGISHHGTYPLSHGRLIAMDRTPGARRLSFLIGAPGEPFAGICQELQAIRAETLRGSVQGVAVHADHRLDGLMLSCHAGMSVSHSRFPCILVLRHDRRLTWFLHGKTNTAIAAGTLRYGFLDLVVPEKHNNDDKKRGPGCNNTGTYDGTEDAEQG